MQTFRNLINLVEYTESIDEEVKALAEATERWLRTNVSEYLASLPVIPSLGVLPCLVRPR